MRFNSPQTQLYILFSYYALSEAIPTMVLQYPLQLVPPEYVAKYTLYSVYAWKPQLVSSFAYLVGIPVFNILGPRITLILNSLFGALYVISCIANYYGDAHRFFVAGAFLNCIFYSFARVSIFTLILTYPREQRKARVLSAFLIIRNIFAVFGLIVPTPISESTQKNYHIGIVVTVVYCVSALLSIAIIPMTRVIRDNGIYLQARKYGVAAEIAKTLQVFVNPWLWLLIPLVFSFELVDNSTNYTYTTKLSYISGYLGAILTIVLGSVLDIGSVVRRRRGIYGFIYFCLVTIPALVLLIVISTRGIHTENYSSMPRGAALVKIGQYRVDHYLGLCFAATFFRDMMNGCITMFILWAFGTLTNNIDMIARFVGVYFSVREFGSMIDSRRYGDTKYGLPSQTPFYIGCGLVVISLLCVFKVVDRIPDTNNWSLPVIMPSRLDTESSDDTKKQDRKR